jgi:AcrR family transcriptional regulator
MRTPGRALPDSVLPANPDAEHGPVDAEPCARPGRPRNCATEELVANAVLDALVEEGFEGMSVDRVARRAGVGRATIYRRWPGKAEMIIDAIGGRTFDRIAIPDTGQLHSDLEQMLREVQQCMTDEYRIIQAIHVEQLRHPELGEAFRSRFLTRRRAAMRTILERAVDRGELSSDDDLDLLGAAGPALIWQQLTLFGGHPSQGLPGRITEFLLAGRLGLRAGVLPDHPAG